MYPVMPTDPATTLYCTLEQFFQGSDCTALLSSVPMDRAIIKDYRDPIFVTPTHRIDLNGFSQSPTTCVCLVQNSDAEMPELHIRHFHQFAITVGDVIGSTAFARRAALFLICDQQPIKLFLMNLLTGELPPEELEVYYEDYGFDDDPMD